MYFIFITLANIKCKISLLDRSLFKYLKEEYCCDRKIEDIKPYLEVCILHRTDIIEFIIKKPYQFTIVLSKERLVYHGNINYILRSIISYCLLSKNIILLHASSCRYQGKGYVFTGRSGFGKTTIIKKVLLSNIYSNDTAIVKKYGNNFILYPSPFDRLHMDEQIKKPIRVQKVLCIEQSPRNKVYKLSIERRIEYLFGNIIHRYLLIRNWFDDKKAIKKIFLKRNSLFMSFSKTNIIVGFRFTKDVNIQNIMSQLVNSSTEL